MALKDLAPDAETDAEVSDVEGFETSANESDGGGEYDIVDPASVSDEAEETASESVEGDNTVDEVPGDSPDASAPPAATEEPASAGPESISPELLEQAGQLGFRYEDIKSLATEDAVRTAVRQKAALLNEALRLQQQQQQDQQSPDGDTDELRQKLDALVENNFDPQLVEALEAVLGKNAALEQNMQAMSQQTEQQRQQMEQQVHQMQQRQVQDEARKQVGWLDDQFAALPDSYRQRVGDGSSLQMDQTTAEYQNRDRISRIALNFSENWQNFGFAAADDPQIVSAAAAAAFGEDARTAAREEMKQQMRDNGRQVTSRPTHTQTVPKDPEERAAQFADNHRLFQR